MSLTQYAFASLVLVQDGAPKATIVVAKDALTANPDPNPDATWSEQPATNKVAGAARDLQTYIGKISGAKLPIVSDEKDPGGTVILVGKSALTQPLNDKIPSGLTPSRREEGFVVLTKGNHLLLAGNDEGPYHGTEYAVAAFLERLGVRWFMPGDFGEVVPKQATIKVDDEEVREKPDFPMRNWWGGRASEMAIPEYRWKIRNRMLWPVKNVKTLSSFFHAATRPSATNSFSSASSTPSEFTVFPNLRNPSRIALSAGSSIR
jgi:hypothetical protein